MFCVEPGFGQRDADDFRVVHLLWPLPHVLEYGLDVRRERALGLGGHRPAHELERIDGKCGLKLSASSLWRATKRRVSSIS